MGNEIEVRTTSAVARPGDHGLAASGDLARAQQLKEDLVRLRAAHEALLRGVPPTFTSSVQALLGLREEDLSPGLWKAWERVQQELEWPLREKIGRLEHELLHLLGVR